MNHADLKDRIMVAINLYPKPLTQADVLEVATIVMQNDGGPLNQFNKWFELNGAHLTESVNA